MGKLCTKPALRLRLASLAAAAMGLVAHPAMADETKCVGLKDRAIAPTAIALPTTGVVVDTAEWVAAGGSFCKVKGRIKPVDSAAPAINFEVNLPEAWNAKAIQYGGGGLNGVLITGLDSLRDDRPGTPTPLRQGYMTFGADGGHQAAPGVDIQAFALNDEALTNHAYGAYKKTHDAVLAIAALYYGRRPSKTYYVGGSEGAREALMSIQRYPNDYDGVIATVPVLSWMGANLAEYRQYIALLNNGWMSAAKVKLVQGAALEACDGADGVKDGVIARYMGCDGAQTLARLRCRDGADTGDDCLSDGQLALIRTVRSPYPYAFPLSHDERSYPPYPTGGETNPTGLVPTIVPAAKPGPEDTGRANYAVGDMRYFVTRNPSFSGPLDEKVYADRIRQISALMDANNPDLSAFRRHGGKLIIKSNAADYLVSPQSIWKYYENIQKTMGASAAESFVRLYVAPGVQHAGRGFEADGKPVPDRVDLLPVLEAWAEHDQPPPEQLTLGSYDNAGHAIAAWPLCRYPSYPHFDGKGDPSKADAYACRSAR